MKKINAEDYSGLLVKLQSKGVITDAYKLHLEVSD